jgi:hypothetical protein
METAESPENFSWGFFWAKQKPLQIELEGLLC